MKKITLHNLAITNFKGVKYFAEELGGDDVTITAENGVGKTTIYDAFLWLLFGKDSTGRKEFQIRPLDKRNNPIKGVVVGVNANIIVDGVDHHFRREHHEKVVKNQLRGYETKYWVDDVPYKQKEYSEYVKKIITEEHFKLLTDLHFFNSKLEWKERRAVLLEIAGEIGEPEGFEELLAEMKDRPMDAFKKVLSERKKAYDDERDEINPRIDEILRGFEHPTEDTVGLEKRRAKFNKVIKALNANRQELVEKETERAALNTEIANLVIQQKRREVELESDMSGVQMLLAEKTHIAERIAEDEQLVNAIENELGAFDSKMKAKKEERETLQESLDLLRTEYSEIMETKEDTVCYACGQKLPTNFIKELREKLSVRLGKVNEKAEGKQDEVSKVSKLIEALAKNQLLMIETKEKAEKELAGTRERADMRLAEIEVEVKDRPTIPPKEDETWIVMTEGIEERKEQLGEPVEDQLTAIETEKTAANKELMEINEALAQADRMVKDRTRIKELEAKEKELAQSIADVEKMLSDIEQYKAQQSGMITDAVNGLFKVTNFKMFKELLNGGLEECCEAMFNGVPYSDMSTGEGIYVGSDINNVLSEHYGYLVPLFIDHAESLSLPIVTKSQTIKLFMRESVKELLIETSARKVVA